jgi:hypothetical protein
MSRWGRFWTGWAVFASLASGTLAGKWSIDVLDLTPEGIPPAIFLFVTFSMLYFMLRGIEVWDKERSARLRKERRFTFPHDPFAP